MTFDKSKLGANSLLTLGRDPWLAGKGVISKGILIKLFLVEKRDLVDRYYLRYRSLICRFSNNSKHINDIINNKRLKTFVIDDVVDVFRVV